jgi:exodeoxyribonuclease V alpha subunit
LTSNFSVIAGGPGTGKTHTIAAMLAALAAGEGEFPKVALCAPTGKAAARLGEAISNLAEQLGDPRISVALETVEPSTMHRLLGWTWGRGRFAYNATNRLPHDLVIVDEMSMVSLPMAAKLLAAVRDDAAVVLVGDPHQLESIEAGTVLADIVGPSDIDAEPSGSPMAAHIVVLDRVHRFDEDSAIADFAEAVRRGDADAAIELLQAGRDRLRWTEDRSGVEFHDLWDTVVEQRTRMVALAQNGTRGSQALDALAELAVLCARREGREGVSGWGRAIETALDERFTGLRWGTPWYAGRPVMITSNDYTLELYNGDIGICVDTDEGPRVIFDRKDLPIPPSHLGEHTTVHAMTIHKSQGSQFKEVVVVLPGESSRLLTRQLLYTAVTRAQQRVRIVGTEDVVRHAIARSVQRASGLGVRLWGNEGMGFA